MKILSGGAPELGGQCEPYFQMPAPQHPNAPFGAGPD